MRIRLLQILLFAPILPFAAQGENQDLATAGKWVLPDGVERIQDLAYRDGSAKPLTLDVYKPLDYSGCPLSFLIYVHGGGYRKGVKEEILEIPFFRESLLSLVAEKKIGLAAVNYGKASKKHPLPELIQDTRDAAGWLLEHAGDYDFNAEKFGFLGETSGGHLALMAGLTMGQKESDASPALAHSPSFIIAFAPPSDLVKIAEEVAEGDEVGKKKIRTQLKIGLGGTLEEVPENYAASSPVNFLTKNSPPLLIITGKDDVRFEQSEWLRDAAAEAGADFQLIALENAGARVFEGYEGMKPTLEELKTSLQDFIKAHL